MAASNIFLPWVRQGVAGAVETEDPIGDTSKSLDSRVNLDVTVQLNGNAVAEPTVTVRVYGPGDVTGFDARQVIRTEPLHLSSDFEPNYFPFVEFDRPDFPWMFTPAKANANDQLRPWICLVIVEKNEDNLTIDPARPLPVLKVNAAAELPDLSESWAWAHAQVSAEGKGDITNILTHHPAQNLSRLICPRRLEEKKSYNACVVPAFEAGRRAGLGLEITDEILLPAWTEATQDIELPVYYHWEFATGATGDFESLVWLLERRPLSNDLLGKRMVEVRNSDPDNPWPVVEAIPLEGALRPANQTDPLESLQKQENYKAFQENLRSLLNKVENPDAPIAIPPGLPIAPPTYGRWQAAQLSIPDPAATPDKKNVRWLRELNLNPSHRAAAGIGTQIVQEQQEQLMASAWEQVGEIEKANQLLRQAQLSRDAGTAIYERHLAVLPPEQLLIMTGQVHARVRVEAGKDKTILAAIKESRVPPALLQGAFRKLVRPRGRLARRMKPYGGIEFGRLIRRINEGALEITPRVGLPNGLVTMEKVLGRFERGDRFCSVTPDRLRGAAPDLPDLRQIQAELKVAGPDRERALQRLLFIITAIAHQSGMEPCAPPAPPPKAMLPLQDFKKILLERLHPAKTITARISSRIVFPPNWKPDDVLETIQAAPEFPTPMYKPLADLSQELMLPGLEHVPPNTMALLETNPRFIESYLVGLNHEMSRELLWREFPTDQRGTYFRQFWEVKGFVDEKPLNKESLISRFHEILKKRDIALLRNYLDQLKKLYPNDEDGMLKEAHSALLKEELKDIDPIHLWDSNSALGENLGGADRESQIVLLIRGDLLRRYPRAIIYAAEAEWVEAKDARNNPVWVRQPKSLLSAEDIARSKRPEKYPIFQGALSPDISFLGFDMDSTVAKGVDDPSAKKAGFFFVLQQPPTEPRFGLDETEPPEKDKTRTWRDLSWKSVKIQKNHIRLLPLHDPKDERNTYSGPAKPPDDKISWGANSAAMAYITMQAPFRVAIHASDLLP